MSRLAWLVAVSVAVSMRGGAAQELAPPGGTAAEPRGLAEVFAETADVTLAPGQKVGEVVRGLAERHRARIEFAEPDLAERPLGDLKNEITFRGVPFQLALGYALGRAGLVSEARDGTIVVMDRVEAKLPAAEKIAAALDQETRLEFPATPLRDAVKFLADVHDINIILDEPAATDAGIDIGANVDIVMQDVKLAAALDLLLEPAGLTYVTANDVLLVTTPDRAAREIDTRSYDVSAIAGESGYTNETANVVTQLLEPRSSLANAMIAAQGGPPVPLPQPQIVAYRQQLLVTASWADQRRVAEILKLMRPEEAGGKKGVGR